MIRCDSFTEQKHWTITLYVQRC